VQKTPEEGTTCATRRTAVAALLASGVQAAAPSWNDRAPKAIVEFVEGHEGGRPTRARRAHRDVRQRRSGGAAALLQFLFASTA
jgi:hypothetical protein